MLWKALCEGAGLRSREQHPMSGLVSQQRMYQETTESALFLFRTEYDSQ